MVAQTRRFEVVSKIFGRGIFTLGLEMDWEFEPSFNSEVSLLEKGTWRILSTGCPAKWHKDQAEDARHPGTGSYILEGEDDYELGETEDDEQGLAELRASVQPAELFETPPGKWLTIVTDIGEVLGFEIVRELP